MTAIGAGAAGAVLLAGAVAVGQGAAALVGLLAY